MKTTKLVEKLPAGILVSDTKYPRGGYVESFDLWLSTTFGWCIPTLSIRRSHRFGGGYERTYATSVDGRQCRIGTNTRRSSVTVYVTKKTAKRLAKFTALKNEGEEKANNTRDIISTRRMRRASFGW